MNEPKNIKVAIVDDHELFVDGIEALLAHDPVLTLVAKCADGRSALESLLEIEADVLLLDVSLPDTSGIEICAELREKVPHLKILALSMHNDQSLIGGMIAAGAMGYMLKNVGKDELLTAIRTVASGQKYYSGAVTEALLRQMPPAPLPPKLSGRELEVLRLIAQGFTNKEIAAKLFLSQKTVDTHRTNLMYKLNVHNAASLAAEASRLNLLG